MPFEIPEGLNHDVFALAWMLGRWEGVGKGSIPGEGEFEFGQIIDFSHNGGPYLHYLSQTFEMDDDGAFTKPLTMETGFWRPQPDASLEVVMCDPDGYAEVWFGSIKQAQIQLVTDAVARTQTSKVPYTGGQRLYGNVEGDLLWTFDRATTEHTLQPYMWARLARAEAVGGGSVVSGSAEGQRTVVSEDGASTVVTGSPEDA